MKFFGRYYVGLGADCHPAFHLKRLGLRKRSYPLDWVWTPDMNSLISTIDRRFEGYTDVEELHHYPEFFDAIKMDKFVTCPMRHRRFNITFGHDFSPENFQDGIMSPQSAYEFRCKYKRRAEAYMRMLETAGNHVIFCRRRKNFKERAEPFDDFLAQKLPRLKVRIFVYDILGSEFRHVEDVGRVSYYKMPLVSRDNAGFLWAEGWDRLADVIRESSCY